MGRDQDKIDFVVFWVDGNDHKWCVDKNEWAKKLGIAKNANIDASEKRYRDYGLLKYWFRGVEQFAPWVNKIHFVTCGHVPEWLNTSHPKLHIVKHADYMPSGALPTFNSNAIETSVHKIDGLAECFVLFNDDMYLTAPVKEKYFFKNGVPCNMMSFHPVISTERLPHYKTLSNNMSIINSNFSYKKAVRKNFFKYISLRQGKYLLRTLPMLQYQDFVGFANYHGPISYTKTTCKEVWEKEHKRMEKTLYSRFRNYENDVSDWVFNYWQFASGNFYQKPPAHERNGSMDNIKVPRWIVSKKYKIVGIGDPKNDINGASKKVEAAFRQVLPNKSEFEK